MKQILVSLFVITVLTVFNPCIAQDKVIKIYSDDFAGASLELSQGKYDFMYLVRAGVATVKSVKVPKGMKVTLYERDHFEGTSLALTDNANTQFLEAKGFGNIALNISLVVEELAKESPLMNGPFVTIYKDDFGGASKELRPGQYDHFELGDVSNDHLSSVRIPKGLKVTLYEHGGFQGKKLVLTGDTRAAFLVSSKFNDLTSSIVVEEEPIVEKKPVEKPAPVKVTEVVKPADNIESPLKSADAVIKPPTEPIIYQGDFSGTSNSLIAGRYSSDQLRIGDNELSSIKIPKGFQVTLYDGDAFEGRSLVLTEDKRASYFAENNFNNITSSIVVEVIPMVTLYEGDYSGVASSLVPGKYSGREMGIGNDQLSSVRVPRGLQVTLFEDEAFEGRKLVLTQDSGTDVINDNGFNNTTSSAIVEIFEKPVPMVTLFQDDYSGVSKKLPVGSFELSQLGIADNSLSSVQVPRGLQVTIYEHAGFRGRAMTLRNNANMNFFSANGFNDIATSIVIEKTGDDEKTVIIYADVFSGPSQSLTPGRYSLKDITLGDNQISSARVPKGMRLVMHEDDNFRGYSLTAERDIDLSQSKPFDNRTSSVIVEDLFVPIISPVETVQVTPPAEVKPAEQPKKESVAIEPPCLMTASQFDNAYRAIDAKPFREERMETARLATKGKCLTLEQIRSVGKLFMDEDQRLEFMKYAYELAREKEEYYLLADAFNFMSTRDAFNQFLKSK